MPALNHLVPAGSIWAVVPIPEGSGPLQPDLVVEDMRQRINVPVAGTVTFTLSA